MLKIRLQRTGRENIPTYRLVVAEKRDPVKGRHHEVLGHYLPARNPAVFEHNDERIADWIQKGAIPSDTVARLLRKAGLKGMDKFIHTYTKKKSKKTGEAAAPAGATATAGAPVPQA
ncbi:MAG: 30S ribosomal protein S16 [Patescibacteria group bacterium]